MHCHLKPPDPLALLGFNHQAHSAPTYQISTELGNTRHSYLLFGNFFSSVFHGWGRFRSPYFSELRGQENYTNYEEHTEQSSALTAF